MSLWWVLSLLLLWFFFVYPLVPLCNEFPLVFLNTQRKSVKSWRVNFVGMTDTWNSPAAGERMLRHARACVYTDLLDIHCASPHSSFAPTFLSKGMLGIGMECRRYCIFFHHNLVWYSSSFPHSRIGCSYDLGSVRLGFPIWIRPGPVCTSANSENRI
jgi:hypothetical protein